MSVRAARFRPLCIAVLVAALVAALCAAVLWRAAAPAAADPPAGQSTLVASRPDVVSARIAAASQRSRVEVTSLRDEYSSTYVNADSTLTTETSTTPVRVMRGGKWVAVDYSLQHVDGGWSPAVSPVPVVFSDGGDKDAVSLGDGSKQVDLSWDVTLPKPTVDGAEAHYDLGGGETLVLAATPTGFEQSLVLDHAPASLPQVRLPFDTSALDLRADGSGGGFEFRNTAGDVVYQMPAPMMYGADRDPATDEPIQSHVVSATLTQTADGARLDLSPSMAWLNDPATTYPVTIDPIVTTVGDAMDTYVQDNVTTAPGSTSTLRAGSYSGHAARTLMKFWDMTKFNGKHIVSAQLKGYFTGANSCTPKTLYAAALSSDWNANVLWSNRPSTNWSYTGSKSMAHGAAGSSCPNAYDSIEIKNIAQAWANRTIPNYGITLYGDEANNNTQAWTFCSRNPGTSGNSCIYSSRVPVLTVTYNSIPGANQSRGLHPCASQCTSPVLTNTTTPQLVDTFTDADGGNLRYDFEVYAGTSDSPTTKVTSGSVNTTSGTHASWTVPAGKLTNGASYEFRDRAYDGTDYGPWSASYMKFTVDTSAPATPSVSSTTWTDGQWDADRGGTMSWSDTSSDVAGYQWQLDGGSWSATTTATSHALNNLADDTLHTFAVKAIDKAGNVSPVKTFTIGVGTGGLTSPADGDSTQARVTLTAHAPAGTPYVTYQWRQGDTTDWANIPTADVTIPGSDTQPGTWPVVAVDDSTNGTASYTWNLRATITDAHGDDGDVEVQACLSASASGSNPVCQGEPTHVQLSAHSFDAANATTDLGPGTLSLLTGDYSLSAADADITAYNSTLSVSRTATTLKPAPASSDAGGVFGPGWTASLDGPDAGDAGQTPKPAADKTYLTFTDAAGGQTTYAHPTGLAADTISYTDIDDADDHAVATYSWRNPTSPAAPHITLTQPDGTATTWTQSAGSATWTPYSVIATGTAATNTSSYYYTSDGLASRIVAASPTGVDCTSQTKADTNKGCRSLTFDYDPATHRLNLIKLRAWDPITSAMVTTPIAQYDYNSDGRLAHAWDPRISPALKSGYTYTDDGRISTVTPPGLAAWTLHYDSSGRVSTVTRPDPSGQTATSTIVYQVPLSGDGLPDLTHDTTATWGENDDLPTTGTAIFNPDHQPAGASADAVATADWPYASIAYLDAQGRDINDAAYGAGDWQIDTTQYDSLGNDAWDLTAGNRAQALHPTDGTDPYVAALDDPADRADLLASTTTYNAGSDTLAAGSEIVDQQGPMHPVTLNDGTIIDARDDTATSYDEGAPNNDDHVVTNPDGTTTDLGPYMLPTSTTTSALDTTGTPNDPQTSTTGYGPVDSGDPSGWNTKQATTATDPGGLTTKTRYNSAGQITEQRLPGDPNGTGPRTTLTTYYTASGAGDCTDAALAGLVCATAPAGQPSTGKPLAVTSYNYDMYDAVTGKTEQYGTAGDAVTRTTSASYDNAGRITGSSLSVDPVSAGGTPVPAVNYSYDPDTGLPSTKSTGSGSNQQTLTSGYDSLGQATSYTDATGNTATTSYDIDGRITALNDGKGTTNYTYDSTSEHRGLVTSEDIGVTGAPSTFTAAYDADGNLTTETYPNGLTATSGHDNDGNQTSLDYAMSGTDWLSFTQSMDAQGQIAGQSSPQSAQTFTYDGSDRLTTVQDTLNDPTSGTTQCTTRSYSFDDDSNRTSLKSYPDAGTDPGNGSCSATTTPTVTNSSYDQADRLSNPGYGYDTLGRTTTVPEADAHGVGGHAATSGDLYLAYHANDMVSREDQASGSVTFTLDPEQSRINTTIDGDTTTTNHYADGTDTPVWTSTAATAWRRDLSDMGGGLAATSDQDGRVELQVPNLHGDIYATVIDSVTAAGPDETIETTEYGQSRAPNAANSDYGWLGAAQRSADSLGGMIVMGVRLYNPSSGLFLTADSVYSGNPNSYTYPLDPISDTDLSGQCGEHGNPHVACDPFRPLHWSGFHYQRFNTYFREGRPYKLGQYKTFGVQHVMDKHVGPNKVDAWDNREDMLHDVEWILLHVSATFDKMRRPGVYWLSHTFTASCGCKYRVTVIYDYNLTAHDGNPLGVRTAWKKKLP